MFEPFDCWCCSCCPGDIDQILNQEQSLYWKTKQQFRTYSISAMVNQRYMTEGMPGCRESGIDRMKLGASRIVTTLCKPNQGAPSALNPSVMISILAII